MLFGHFVMHHRTAVGSRKGFLCGLELFLQADDGFIFEPGRTLQIALALGIFKLHLGSRDFLFDFLDLSDGFFVAFPAGS